MTRLITALFMTLLCAVPAMAQQPKLNDKAAAFFDDTTVKEIRIYFDDPNWYNTLVQAHQNQNQTGDPFFPCRFKYGSIELPKVGVRFKGNSSFRRNGIKRPFKFDFNEYDTTINFLGLHKLNLNTNDLAPDFMREKLFSDFAGKFVTAMRAVHVRLYVNDAYYGLYTAMEQPDKDMMQSRFGENEDGNLYEGNEILGGTAGRPDLTWRGSDPAVYRPIYELETNQEANDYSGLIEFINVLNNTPAAELPAKLEPIADVEQLLTWLAINHLFVNLDSYVNDAGEYYLYDRSRDGKFIYVQWDHNESFGTTGDGTPRIANPFAFDVFWLPAATQQRPLAQKLWAVPEYRQLYLRIFAKLMREGFNVESFTPRVNQLADLIREHVYADPNKITTNAQFDLALTSQTTSGGAGGPGGALPIYGLTQFVRERYNYMRGYLNSLAQPSDVRLNEVVAVNNGVFKDAAGDADPWIEVHNLGPGAVTLNNFYLTDDQANPTKWQLPAKTLADGDYLILWLDGETSEGDTHASFRAAASGGKLFLYSAQTATQTVVDMVTYPASTSGQSYVRLGNYGGNWATSFQPTPAINNPGAGSSSTQSPSQGTGQLLINEVMADNEDAFRDPDAPTEHDDWIEVFNPGTSAVNMSGMYITDNRNNPTKWKVPEGVTIPARGYLVFIADDNQTTQGPLHTSFSLDADGEGVFIYATNGTTLIDSVTFGIQQEDISFGRITDGDPIWSIFRPSTPGASNTAAYVNSVVGAAGFYLGPTAAGQIVSLFGQNLTSGVVVASSAPLPTTLGGVTITITDKNNAARNAPLFFVSGGQINFQIPPGTATGRAKISIKKQDGSTIGGDLLVERVGPGLFSANANGQGVGASVALRIAASGAQTYEPLYRYDAAQQRNVAVPLNLGPETDKVYLLLNGSGIRGVEQLSDVTVEVANQLVPVLYAGQQGDFVGLDQVNVGQLPRTLIGKGAVEVVIRVNGRRANRITLTIQ
ncbi:MAG: CotH kinase family protein [Blastocatellia bacterium]